jgi:hypothetical protein
LILWVLFFFIPLSICISSSCSPFNISFQVPLFWLSSTPTWLLCPQLLFLSISNTCNSQLLCSTLPSSISPPSLGVVLSWNTYFFLDNLSLCPSDILSVHLNLLWKMFSCNTHFLNFLTRILTYKVLNESSHI